MEQYNKQHEEVLDEIKATFYKMEIRIKYFNEVNEQLEKFKKDLMENTNTILDEILTLQYKLDKIKYDNTKHEKLISIIGTNIKNMNEILEDTPKYLHKIKHDMPEDVNDFFFPK